MGEPCSTSGSWMQRWSGTRSRFAGNLVHGASMLHPLVRSNSRSHGSSNRLRGRCGVGGGLEGATTADGWFWPAGLVIHFEIASF
jgi:hypothetical protein